MSDLTDDELRRALLEVDILLKRKQLWWEHPRNAAIVLGVVVALVSGIAGWAGFQLGSRPPQQIIVHLDQPLRMP